MMNIMKMVKIVTVMTMMMMMMKVGRKKMRIIIDINQEFKGEF